MTELEIGAGAAERIPAPTTPGSAAQTIATKMVQLLSRNAGRGPTQARTILNTNLVVVVFHNVMTTGEQTLAAADGATHVRTTRLQVQDIIRDEAREIVERATGREVVTVLSDIDPGSDIAAQVFVLDQIPETGDVDVVEISAE